MSADGRLAILHTEASCGWGGQEIRILTEMHAMQARGHRVHLLTPVHADIYRAARERGLPVDAMRIEFRRLGGFAALARWLRKHGHAFDVINTHSSADSWLTAWTRVAMPSLPPLVRTRHVSTPVNRSAATRWLYTRATAYIVVTGEALKQQLVRDNGFDPAHIGSVRTGIDLARFRPMPRDEARARLAIDARPAIAIVATLRDWKGHDVLLDAWPAIRERAPGWQLLFVGDGPRRAHLETRVRTAGLQSDVRFTGNRNDVESWFAAADIVALPSWGEEGVPQSLMQAAACGRCAVSTTVGAIEEAVVHERTGLLVPPRDPVALGDALVRLMTSTPMRTAMGDAAHAHAMQHFGIERMADAMEAVFRRVVAESR